MQTYQNNPHQFIKHIISKEHELSEDRIKTILTASIIRYLKGRTTLSFITDLAAEITEEHDTLLKGDLLEIISFLNLLGYQTKFAHISQHVINDRLHKALEKLVPSKNTAAN